MPGMCSLGRNRSRGKNGEISGKTPFFAPLVSFFMDLYA